MSNKQIIIDGVDVSVCKLYNEDNGVVAPDGTAERTELCYLTNDYCENNPNCYYKQLKRKEQECEELKHEVELMMDCASCKVDEYKQTLTEIKEIAKNMNEECFYDDFDCMNCDMQNGCTYFNKKQILQKNSEVENDNA